MAKHILFPICILLCITLFFTNCDDNSDPLVGTWDYTERVVSECANVSENTTVNYTGDGDCETIENVTACFKLSIAMNSGNYTISKHAVIGENETTIIEEEGTYKLDFGFGDNVLFCTDLFCRVTRFQVTGDVLSLENAADGSSCITTINATRR